MFILVSKLTIALSGANSSSSKRGFKLAPQSKKEKSYGCGCQWSDAATSRSDEGCRCGVSELDNHHNLAFLADPPG